MVRKRNSAEEWGRVFREQWTSGQSVAAYCRRSGVAQSSFYAWRRRLRDSADFVEVRRPSPPAARADFEARWPSPPGSHVGVIELRLGGERSVMVRPGFDQRTLRELVAALESVPYVGDDADAVFRGARREAGA